MKINQRGEQIIEEHLFAYVGQTDITDQDRDVAIKLILEHLNLQIIATNATKHGDRQLILRPTGAI